jgi:hypothetical protein
LYRLPPRRELETESGRGRRALGGYGAPVEALDASAIVFFPLPIVQFTFPSEMKTS